MHPPPPPPSPPNPFKAKRPWPPDFARLTDRDQFRLELRYRRRAQLKYARPNWGRAVVVAQWGVCGAIIAYMALFAEYEQENHVFQPFRKWFFGLGDGFWRSSPSPPQTTAGTTAGEREGR